MQDNNCIYLDFIFWLRIIFLILGFQVMCVCVCAARTYCVRSLCGTAECVRGIHYMQAARAHTRRGTSTLRSHIFTIGNRAWALTSDEGACWILFHFMLRFLSHTLPSTDFRFAYLYFRFHLQSFLVAGSLSELNFIQFWYELKCIVAASMHCNINRRYQPPHMRDTFISGPEQLVRRRSQSASTGIIAPKS